MCILCVYTCSVCPMYCMCAPNHISSICYTSQLFPTASMYPIRFYVLCVSHCVLCVLPIGFVLFVLLLNCFLLLMYPMCFYVFCVSYMSYVCLPIMFVLCALLLECLLLILCTNVLLRVLCAICIVCVLPIGFVLLVLLL